jgi:hypothetical protein
MKASSSSSFLAKQTKTHPSAVDSGELAVEIVQAIAQLFQRRQKRAISSRLIVAPASVIYLRPKIVAADRTR